MVESQNTKEYIGFNFVSDTMVGSIMGMLLGYGGVIVPIKREAEAMFERGDGLILNGMRSKKTFIRLHGTLCGGALYGMSLGTYIVAHHFLVEMRGVEKVYSNWIGAGVATFAAATIMYPGSPLYRVPAAVYAAGSCISFGYYRCTKSY